MVNEILSGLPSRSCLFTVRKNYWILILMLLELFCLPLQQAAWACDTSSSGTTVDPPDHKLNKCVLNGLVGYSLCLTNQCYGYEITNWVVQGGTYAVTWSYDPVNGWEANVTKDDPHFGSSAGFTGFLLSHDGNAQKQSVSVNGTGFLYIENPPDPTPIITGISASASFDVDDGDTCSACAPADPSNPNDPTATVAALGTAQANNYVGPELTFNLGLSSYDRTAGNISLTARYASAALSDPAALYVPFTNVGTSSGTYEIIKDTNGVIQQVRTPQGLVNVAVQNAYSYQLQLFYDANVTPKSGGLYGTNAAAFATWTMSNPNGATNNNQLVVSLSRSGVTDPHYTFTKSSIGGIDTWQLTDAGNLRTVNSWQVAATNAGYSTVTDYFQQVLSGTNVVQSVQKTYGITNGLSVLLKTIEGTGTTTNVTAYYYGSNAWLQRVDYPNGSWVHYVYDSSRRITKKYSTYLNYSPPAVGTEPNPLTDHCVEVDYDYGLWVTGDHVPDNPWPGDVARLEQMFLPAFDGSTWSKQEVVRIYRATPQSDELDEYRCPTPGAAWNAAGNLVTKTTTYWNPTNANAYAKPRWQVLPDGTAKLYSYSSDNNGILTNILVSVGQPDNTISPTNIVEGSQSSTTINGLGQVTLVTGKVITNGVTGFIVAQDTYSHSGSLQQDLTHVDLGSRTNQYFFACCGLDNSIDPDSVQRTYDYDLLRRKVAEKVLRGDNSGVKTTNVLDAAGRVLATIRIGTNGNSMTLVQNSYDSLGRFIGQTNALGGVTSITNVIVSNQICVTNVYPDGGTRVEVSYRDGRSQSISGTAVFPEERRYGIEQDGIGGPWRRFTTTIKMSSTGGTNEWTKTYLDGVDRPYKTIYASASGTSASVSYYDAFGHVTNTVEPDGVSMLYFFNAKGERTYSVLDSNVNYSVDWSGNDRITFTTNDIVVDQGITVRRTRTYVWGTSANASNLVSTFEQSVDGLQQWKIVWNNGTGITNRVTTTYGTNDFRFTTNTAPDGSYSVSVYQYGLLTGITAYDSTGAQLTSTGYSYDEHYRQNQISDARNGTTTTWYNAMDVVGSTKSPVPGSGQSAQVTTNFFDSTGRIIATKLPDNTYVSNKFDVTGLLTNTFGSRIYPVAYIYDAQGRMKTMTTWQNFAGGQGTATTTWNYDVYRGWLTNKSYADGSGPIYNYTLAGRMSARIWARGVTNTYSYDFAGGLSGISYSDGTPGITYGYDRLGRQKTIVENGITTTLTYNDASQVLSESYSGGTLDGLSMTNRYDQFLRRTNLIAFNSTTPLLTNSYSFDAASRLQTVRDGGTNSATYTYVANSPLVSQILFTNGTAQRMVTTKSYDLLNRLTNIVSTTSGTSVVSFGYQYNSADQRTTRTDADGSYWVYTYDTLGQVTSGKKYRSDGTPVAGQQFEYSFDDIGNRKLTGVGGDQFGASLRYANYSANNLNQYTSRDVPGFVNVVGSAKTNATISLWTPDGWYSPATRHGEYYRGELAVNNSTGALYLTITNLAVLANGTNSDIVTNVIGNLFLAKNQEAFNYDNDGNLTVDGRWTYTWDGENRLIQMIRDTDSPSGARQKLTFEYDYIGRRIRKKYYTYSSGWILNSDTVYVYDGWNLIAELDAASSYVRLRTYVWGLGLNGSGQGAGGVGGLLKVADYSSGATHHFVACDGNGNLAALLDASTAGLTAAYEYGPFSELLRATGVFARKNQIKFSTKFQDNESDLIYYGYRYCAPSVGRWISRDPLRERGGRNLYSYVANRPVNAVDLLGLVADGGADPITWKYTCPFCKCLNATVGPPGSRVMGIITPAPPNPVGAPSQLNLAVQTPYSFQVVGNPLKCKCQYIDNGTISGTFGTLGPNSATFTPDNGTHDVPLCSDGTDHPGILSLVGNHGNLPYDMQWNITLTVTCTGTDGSSAQASTSIVGTSGAGQIDW